MRRLLGAVSAATLAVLIHSPAWAATAAPASAAAGRDAAPDAGIAAERLRLAREIIDIGFPADMREAMFLKAVDSMVDQTRGVQLARLDNDPRAKAMINEAIDRMVAMARPVVTHHVPHFMDAYAAGYAREFSHGDLVALRAFVATPAGQRFFSRSANIIDDPAFRTANEAFLRDLQPVMEAEQKMLLDKLLEHFRENPPKEATES